jgi:hypothetical protein
MVMMTIMMMMTMMIRGLLLTHHKLACRHLNVLRWTRSRLACSSVQNTCNVTVGHVLCIGGDMMRVGVP